MVESYTKCTLLNLVTSWTDMTIYFPNLYLTLFSLPHCLLLFIITYITICVYNLRKPIRHKQFMTDFFQNQCWMLQINGLVK